MIKGHINGCTDSECNGIICVECGQIHECNEHDNCKRCGKSMKFYAELSDDNQIEIPEKVWDSSLGDKHTRR